MNTMSAIMNVIVLLAVFGVAVRAHPMFAGKEYAAGVKQLISDKVEVTLPIREFANNNEDPFKNTIFRVKRQDGGDGAEVAPAAPVEPAGGTPDVQTTQGTTETAPPSSTTESSGTKTTISKAAVLLFSLLILVQGNFGNC